MRLLDYGVLEEFSYCLLIEILYWIYIWGTYVCVFFYQHRNHVNSSNFLRNFPFGNFKIKIKSHSTLLSYKFNLLLHRKDISKNSSNFLQYNSTPALYISPWKSFCPSVFRAILSKLKYVYNAIKFGEIKRTLFRWHAQNFMTTYPDSYHFHFKSDLAIVHFISYSTFLLV